MIAFVIVVPRSLSWNDNNQNNTLHFNNGSKVINKLACDLKGMGLDLTWRNACKPRPGFDLQ